MPWLALPFADRAGKAALASRFGVQGIPKFVLLDAATLAVVNAEARSAVAAKRPFPWTRPLVFDLETARVRIPTHARPALRVTGRRCAWWQEPGDINERPSLVVVA